MVESQLLSATAEKTAISWTGGKDCNLALLAAWRDPSLRVTCLVCFRWHGHKFHAHPIAFMEAQAAALDLPLHYVDFTKETESTADYKAAYVKGMRRLRSDHGITVIATGDMDLVGTMTRNWIEECGERAGIRAFLPLWKADRASCLRKLIAERFVVVISCVKSPWFDDSWIGRKIDAKTVADLEAVAAAIPSESGHKPLDLGGEQGEYHTMCIDGPIYSHPVKVVILEQAHELTDQAGQNDNQRWWVIAIQDDKIC